MNDNAGPSGTDRSKEFLDAEAAANRLVEQLQRLEAEASRYLVASQHVEAAAEASRQLTEAIRSASEFGQNEVSRLTELNQSYQARFEVFMAEQQHQQQVLNGLVKRANLGICLAGATAILALYLAISGIL